MGSKFYKPQLSPVSTLTLDTKAPATSSEESAQLSSGADSGSVSPEEPQQHESRPEHPSLAQPQITRSPNESDESGLWFYSRPPPVAPKPGESGSELPSKPFPSNITGGPGASALTNLLRGNSTAQSSLDSSPGKASQSSNVASVYSDAYTVNAVTDRALADRDPGDQDSEDMPPRTGRLKSVRHPGLNVAQPRGPQAVPQYTILRRPKDQDPDGNEVQNEHSAELGPLPLPKDIPSSESLVALGAPVEEPKNAMDPVQYSVRHLEGKPIYFPRIPDDMLFGTCFTAGPHYGTEGNLSLHQVRLPPQVIDAADFPEALGQVLSTVDAQALALDSLSIYDLPDLKPRNDYRTWRRIPGEPGQPATERRNGYRDCTREQLAWIEMMCSTAGAFQETGSMMKFQGLSEEDIAKMFHEKFLCEIPDDWMHLADHLGKGTLKMLCYRQSLRL